MKNLTILFLLFAAVSLMNCDARAQGVWTFQTSGTFESLLGVDAVDASIAYVCGDHGTILKTTDGGTTWVPQESHSFATLYSISFIDKDTGVAVGNEGTVRRTTDGGETWISSSFTAHDLRTVRFYSSSVGYITGGVAGVCGSVFKTTDAGVSWLPVGMSTSQVIYGLSFRTPSLGFVSDYGGVIHKTTDGGTTWSAMSSGVTTVMYALDFADSLQGVAVGAGGRIRRSVSAGAAWGGIVSGTSDYLTGAKFYDSNNGFVVGGNISSNTGIILSTINGGTTWTPLLPGSSRLYHLDFLDATKGYVVGLDGTILNYSLSVGIKEGIREPLLMTYPNPANESMTVDLSAYEFAGKPALMLYDINGRCLLNTIIEETDSYVLQRNGLGAGIYCLLLLDDEGELGSARIIFR